MKSLYIFLIIISFKGILFSQYCEIRNESSNRDFDWRQQEYEFWLRGQGANSSDLFTICSPYYSLGICSGGAQANTLFISTNNPDYKEDDGWELINYDFGTELHPINDPFIIIYNKFESKLRVFYWINSNIRNDLNEIKLDIRFISIDASPSPATHVSALLEHTNTPMRPLEGYSDEDIGIQTPQFYRSQSNGVWLMTDIPIAYDPCTCQHPSMIAIQGIGSEVTSLLLTGEGVGTLNEVIDSNGEVNTTSIFANANNINTAVAKGNAAYKNMNEFTNTIDKLLVRRTNAKIDTEISDQLSQLGYNIDTLSISDIKQMYNQSQSTNPPSGLMSVVGKLFENKVSSIVPNWLKDIVPFANTAISLLDFFVGGGKSTPPKPKSFNQNMQFTFNGTLDTEKDLTQHIILVPGANVYSGDSRVAERKKNM